jgi:hypothetical protein
MIAWWQIATHFAPSKQSLSSARICALDLLNSSLKPDSKAFIEMHGARYLGHEIAWKYGELSTHELAGSQT